MPLPNIFTFSNQFYTFCCILLIAGISFGQYVNTFENEYVLDDLIVIGMNESVKKGINGIPAIIKNYRPESLQVQNNYGYRPVALISFALDVAFFGEDPKYGHIFNVIYFSILCLVIFFTLRMLFPYHSHWLPFLVTLLFAVHPIHTEVVANIKSRDEILCLLFSLLALQSALQYVVKQRKIYYFLFAICFALSLLSKEQALLFCFVIPTTLVIFSNVSIKKYKHIVITLASIFAVRWFIGLQNNVPLSLSIFSIFAYSYWFYYFYKAEIKNFSDLKQASKDSLNIWKEEIKRIEKHPRFWQGIFILVFAIGLLAVFLEVQWFIIFLSAILLGIFGYQKSENKSLLLVLSSILFVAYSINNHSNQFLLLTYFLLSWLFVFHRNQFNSIIPFLISFLFICIGSLQIIKYPFSIIILFFVPLFVFAFRKKVTMIIALAIFVSCFSYLILTDLNSDTIANLAIIILLISGFSLLLYFTQKDIQKQYIFPIVAFMLLIGHINVLSNGTITISDEYEIAYEQKKYAEKQKKLSVAERDAEYGFFIESADLNNTFLWTKKSSVSIATSFYILGRYLKNFFVPHPLIYFYGYNQIPLAYFTNWQVLLSIFIHFSLIALFFFYLTRQPYIAFAIISYLISISLYSQLFFYVPDTMADRHFFMASLPLSLLVVLLLGKILRIDFKTSDKPFLTTNNKISLGIFMLIFILILPTYAHATHKRNKVWKNNLTLFEHDLPYMENCARAHYYYANELLQTYHLIEREKRNPTAEKIAYHFGRSIEISDKSFASYLNLARFYIGHRMFQQSYRVIQLFKQSYDNTFHLHNLFGYHYFQQEDFYKAIDELEKAHEIAPKNNDNYYLLAWAYHNNGNYEKAIEIAEKAIATAPTHETHYLTMSDIHFDYGEYEKAQKTLEKFIAKYPNTIRCYEKLIYQLKERGEKQAANRYQLILEQNIKKQN